MAKSRNVSFQDSWQNLNERKVYMWQVTALARGTVANTREHDVALITGFKLHVTMVNHWTVPTTVHMAIISPLKQEGAEFETSKFFKGAGGSTGSSIGIDYNGITTPSFTPSSEELNYLHINTDQYSVIKHWKILLGTQNAGTAAGNFTSGEKSNYRTVKKYIPIYRPVQYTGATTLDCKTPIYFVIYTAPWGSQGTLNTSTNVAHTHIFQTFFKDPK